MSDEDPDLWMDEDIAECEHHAEACDICAAELDERPAEADPILLVKQAAADLSGIIHNKRDVLPMDVHSELCLIASYLEDFIARTRG